MNKRVLRRNRRTDSSKAARKTPVILFGISLVIFLGGVGNLAWALNGHVIPRDTPAKAHHQTEDAQEEDLYGGELAASSDEQAAPIPLESAAPETAQQPDAPQSMPEPDSQQAALYDEDSRAQGQSQSQTPAPSTTHAEEAPRQSRTVRHEACQETPVYVTVHHQASAAREITVGGLKRIEWTNCPVCGQQHGASYNERVVDHVVETLCPACGSRHAESYDEVLYY